jgi:hypothetical protein
VSNTKLITSIWNEERGKLENEFKKNDKIIHDETDVLINSQLVENTKYHQFGPVRWQACSHSCLGYNVRLTDKKTAVIGNGSLGIQVVPALQPKAARTVNNARYPTWVSISVRV